MKKKLLIFLCLICNPAYSITPVRRLSICKRRLTKYMYNKRKRLVRTYSIKGKRDISLFKTNLNEETQKNKNLVFLEQISILVDEQIYLSYFDREMIKFISTLLITKKNIDVQKPIRNICISFGIHLAFNHCFHLIKESGCYIYKLINHIH